MAASFFFYDLETTGMDPRQSRIMQFAGQRTDMDLKPIGETINELICLTPDILPDPFAILLTGITPQKTLAEGLQETEFIKLFYEQAVTPNTVFIGYNSIRFDDEFMRFLNYRNFYDAYQWQWQDGRSRWDLLDVVRMTRALRPEGIKWPYASDGKPANRLEGLTKVNKLKHDDAHDALSDVQATISVARLIKEKQPELFEFLLSHRSKKSVAALVNKDEPFVYTSAKYPSDFFHTTVVIRLADHPKNDGALVYDLRIDPTPFLNVDIDELIKAWRFSEDKDQLRLPVKTLKYNRCPAIAPLGVIKDIKTQERLKISLEDVKKHLSILRKHQNRFADAVLLALSKLDEQRETLAQQTLVDNDLTVDERLYDGFISGHDKTLMQTLRSEPPEAISNLAKEFSDKRLRSLSPLYKARNFPKSLTAEERSTWDNYIKRKLLSGGQQSRAALFFTQLQELASKNPSKQQQYLLEELRLYGESILPDDVAS